MCIELGGVLASIHDQETADFLGAQYSGAYIGLYKSHAGGDWIWADGSRLTFSNWAADEPNGDGDDVVIMYEGGGKWNVTETEQRKVVCQFNPRI